MLPQCRLLGREFSYDFCCGANYGPGGNKACWAGSFTHQLCCLANATSNSWADVLASQVETEQFYKMDDSTLTRNMEMSGAIIRRGMYF